MGFLLGYITSRRSYDPNSTLRARVCLTTALRSMASFVLGAVWGQRVASAPRTDPSERNYRKKSVAPHLVRYVAVANMWRPTLNVAWGQGLAPGQVTYIFATRIVEMPSTLDCSSAAKASSIYDLNNNRFQAMVRGWMRRPALRCGKSLTC